MELKVVMIILWRIATWKEAKTHKKYIISTAINVQYVLTHIFGKDAIYVGPYDLENMNRIQL